jgi:Sulfotransferase family
MIAAVPAEHGAVAASRPASDTELPISAQRVVLLLGAPRSGTTWLGKIFDSHPGVIYRHEPDLVLRTLDFPKICDEADIATYRSTARRYLDRLTMVRTLKTAGPFPLFRKSFQNGLTFHLRAALLLGLRACQQFPPLSGWARRAQVPDFVGAEAAGHEPTYVIKSVTASGRVRLYAEALPEARIILIIRHPCGQVASMLRGLALNKFEKAVRVEEILGMPQADQLGLTAERLQAMSEAERYAWHWAAMNQKALDDLPRTARTKVLRYEDLGRAPLDVAHDLLEFAGLAWHDQVDHFIETSTRSSGADRYYNVTRNPIAAMNKWRHELSPEDQERVLAVADQTEVGRLFTRAPI